MIIIITTLHTLRLWSPCPPCHKTARFNWIGFELNLDVEFTIKWNPDLINMGLIIFLTFTPFTTLLLPPLLSPLRTSIITTTTIIIIHLWTLFLAYTRQFGPNTGKYTGWSQKLWWWWWCCWWWWWLLRFLILIFIIIPILIIILIIIIVGGKSTRGEVIIGEGVDGLFIEIELIIPNINLTFVTKNPFKINIKITLLPIVSLKPPIIFLIPFPFPIIEIYGIGLILCLVPFSIDRF